MSNVVIQGQGIVGLSTERLLRFHTDIERIEFDDPPKKIRAGNWQEAEWTIICVPTPLSNTSGPMLDVKSVVDAVVTAQTCGFSGTYIIRSTLSLDAMDTFDWLGDRLIIWPEFVRAQHWEQDAVDPSIMIFGGDRGQEFANNFGIMPRTKDFYVSTRIAVLVKLAVNAFLSTKVTFANQIYALCQEHGVDYGVVRDILEKEPRLGTSHWQVPGPDGQFGFGGVCLPKDLIGLLNDFESVGLNAEFFENIIKINEGFRKW